MLALKDALIANQGGTGFKLFRFHRVTRRIANRFGSRTARTWLQAVTHFKAGIDERAIRMALAGQDLAAVEAAVRGSGFGQMMRALEDPLARTAGAAGTASAQVLEEAGFSMQFNAVHPNVVLFARDSSAGLVVQITKDVKEAIRTVVALGAQQGLTIMQQARAIRETVSLAPNVASAPLRFADELRRGDLAATRRRLSATDKAQIRSRIKRGTVTDSFITKMQERYTKSLTNARALTIARTETLRAANFGQQESWVQATRQGVLPADSRRFWIVTPDELLSVEHAQIPSMNPVGRGMDELFDTPDGFFMYPPSRPNCRCGIGLGIPGLQ